MSTIPANQADNPEGGAPIPEDEAPDASEAMNEQLRGDVTSWKAARSETAARQSAEFSVPVVRQPAAKATRARPAKPAPAAAAPAEAKKKPFGMSYDGMSQADYISYMISRGAR